MGSAKLYISTMLADLQTKMDAVMTKSDAQITKLTEMVTALQAVNVSVGQGIVAGNVVPGTDTDTINIIGATVDTPYQDGLTGTTYVEVCRAKCFCDGAITLEGIAKSNNTSAAGLCYSLDGGTTKTAIGADLTTDGNFATRNVTVTVKKLDQIIIYAKKTQSGGITTVKASSIKAKYKVMNLAVDGYVGKI